MGTAPLDGCANCARQAEAIRQMRELLRDIYRDPAVRLMGANGDNYSARIYGLMSNHATREG